jgi:hypothetical protein
LAAVISIGSCTSEHIYGGKCRGTGALISVIIDTVIITISLGGGATICIDIGTDWGSSAIIGTVEHSIIIDIVIFTQIITTIFIHILTSACNSDISKWTTIILVVISIGIIIIILNRIFATITIVIGGDIRGPTGRPIRAIISQVGNAIVIVIIILGAVSTTITVVIVGEVRGPISQPIWAIIEEIWNAITILIHITIIKNGNAPI